MKYVLFVCAARLREGELRHQISRLILAKTTKPAGLADR